MSAYHPGLATGRWSEFSLVEQLANVGSEVGRAVSWAERGRPDMSRRAFERALELLGLTIADERHRHRLKELTRVREALLDHFLGDNEYQSTGESWKRYFAPYAMAAAIRRERGR